MFKKLKEKIADEVAHNPRLQASLDSVNQIASQTYSAFNKEGSGSRDSLTSLNSQASFQNETKGNLSASSSTGQFFSLGEDDDPISLSAANSPTKTPTPSNQDIIGMSKTSTPSGRGRLSSVGSLDASLFPIYEDPGPESVALFSDLESTAGSEAGWDRDDSSAQLSAVSKEQLYGMLAKMRSRYHKYKGRYADLAKAYRNIQAENQKVKEVMQQTQDKALRRISELREQCSLEKQAKQHLEEEFRAEIEEKEHIINTLNTKVSLLKENFDTSPAERSNGPEPPKVEGALVDLSVDSGLHEEGEIVCDETERTSHINEKVKRLEGLLTKCKENIKANKQKIGALTEVKEELATQLELRDNQIQDLNKTNKQLTDEIEQTREKGQGEEIQIAETKLAMHRELLEKDEQMAELRKALAHEQEQLTNREQELEAMRTLKKHQEENFKKELTELAKAQDTMEARLEDERKTAMEELSRGKEAALEQERNRLTLLHKKEVERELSRQEEDLTGRLREVEEEGRLGREEMELRLSQLSASEQLKTAQLSQLSVEKAALESQLGNSKGNGTDSKKLSEQLKELEVVKERVQGVKAEKIVLEEKLSNLTYELVECKKTLGLKEESEKSLKEDLETVKRTIKEKEVGLIAVQSSLDQQKQQTENLQKEKTKLQEFGKKKKVELEKKDEQHGLALQHKEKEIALKIAELQEKDKEISSMLESLARCEEESKVADSKLVTVDQQRREENEQHLAKLEVLKNQLESAGEDKEASLQSRIAIISETNATLINEKEAEIAKLQGELKQSCESLKELEDRLNYNLESSLKTEEEMEAKIKVLELAMSEEGEINGSRLVELENIKNDLETKVAQLQDDLTAHKQANEELGKLKSNHANLETSLKESEANMAVKVEELRDANEKVEDLQNNLEKMQHLDQKTKSLEDQLDQRLIELRDSNEEVEHLKRINDEKEAFRQQLEQQLGQLKEQLSSSSSQQEQLEEVVAHKGNLDKEIQSLKDQVNSRQALQDQMVNYEKELQARVTTLETEKAELENKLRRAEEEKESSLAQLDEAMINNLKEIEELKQDLDMKMRLERDTQHAHKEFQKQNIEYEKKLQDQLEEKNLRIDQLNHDLDSLKKESHQTSEANEKEISALQVKIKNISTALAQRENEVTNLGEKREQLESILEEKEKVLAEKEKIFKDTEENNDQIKAKFETDSKDLIERIRIHEDSLSVQKNKLATQEEKIGIQENKITTQAEKIKMQEDSIQTQEDQIKTLEDNIRIQEDHIKTHEEIIKTQEASMELKEDRIRELTDSLNFSQESIDRLKNGFEDAKNDFEVKATKSTTEIKKLSKSRDRLKSLLDEKEKLLTDLNAEKAIIFGSQEQITSEKNERLVEMTDQISELTQTNRALKEEASDAREKSDELIAEKVELEEKLLKLSENLESLRLEVDSLTGQSTELSEERDSLREELNSLEASFCEVESERSRLEEEKINTAELKNLLSTTTSELTERRAEAEDLRNSLEQLQDISSFNGLKEENAMLSEQLSQLKEEQSNQVNKDLPESSSASSKDLDSTSSKDLERLREDHSIEIVRLRKQISGLQEELSTWQSAGSDDDHTDRKLKTLVREWERKIALKDAEHFQELENLREQQEAELTGIRQEHRSNINRLSEEVSEKVTIVDSLEEEKEELRSRVYQKTEEQFSREQELIKKVDELQSQLESLQEKKANWSWEEDDVMQMTNDSPAIFGVPNDQENSYGANNHNHVKQQHSTSIEDNPEFEYLKNILYEYMMGQQPLILVKVLSAIVKFSPDQVKAITRAEERKQSYLANIKL